MTAESITFESHLPVSATEAYDWHTRPGAVDRMLPPWQPIRIAGMSGGLAEGSTLTFELGRPPFSVKWQARHEEIERGHTFSDRQQRGPFRSWLHRHDFESAAGNSSRIIDTIEYQLPFTGLVTPLVGGRVRNSLRRTFAYRHRTLYSDLTTQARYSHLDAMRVAVTGASGLIGRTLVPYLTTAGHKVIRLVRSEDGCEDSALWNPQQGVADLAKLEGIDAVIHLAGANIAAGRWTSKRKQEIRGSRSEGTARLIESLSKLSTPPRHFLSASAIGFYGDTGSDTVDENDSPGEGFLAEVCEQWEAAAGRAADFAERVTRLRFGVVLTPAGGALAKMLPPFRLGAGGVVGSGRQYMSWISIDDAVAAVLHCLATPSLDGAVNIVAPGASTNRELTRTLGRVLRRPTIAPLPTPAVKLLFGEMGDSMLLASTRVAPSRLLQSGFEFSLGGLEETLRHGLGRFLTFPAPPEEGERRPRSLTAESSHL